MANTPEKTGGYKKVRTGTDGFKGSTASSYDGEAHKENAPSGFKAPQLPVGGGKKLSNADGYRAHEGKKHDGPLRMSGHPKAIRVGRCK